MRLGSNHPSPAVREGQQDGYATSRKPVLRSDNDKVPRPGANDRRSAGSAPRGVVLARPVPCLASVSDIGGRRQLVLASRQVHHSRRHLRVDPTRGRGDPSAELGTSTGRKSSSQKGEFTGASILASPLAPSGIGTIGNLQCSEQRRAGGTIEGPQARRRGNADASPNSATAPKRSAR